MPEGVALTEALLTTFGEAFDEVETYSKNRPSADYLQQLLENDYFIAIAALKRGEVVGGLTAYELKKFELAASVGDDPAIELYTKLGDREDVLHFDIAIST